MKKVAAAVLLLAASVASADTYVQGHYRSDGTYVQPHYRSDSNNSIYDNYSSQGNINPYTGQRGHRNPEYQYQPRY